jgi:hypothetical protein
VVFATIRNEMKMKMKSRARLLQMSNRSAVLAAYRRAMKIARQWPSLVGDYGTPLGENTVAAQDYIKRYSEKIYQKL